MSKLATSEQRFKNISTIKKILIKLIITLCFVNKTGSLANVRIEMAGEVQYIFFILALKGYIERGILTLNKTELDVALRYITNVFTLPPSFHSAAGHNLTREARDSSYTRGVSCS